MEKILEKAYQISDPVTSSNDEMSISLGDIQGFSIITPALESSHVSITICSFSLLNHVKCKPLKFSSNRKDAAKEKRTPHTLALEPQPGFTNVFVEMFS